MKPPQVEQYAGREQAYVKHYFLSSYIERLVYKVAGSYDHIVYIDGFSGPWQSAGENFADTSFGIALQALEAAKTSWGARGRPVKMTALLVEKSTTAFNALKGLETVYPGVEIKPFNLDFRNAIATLINHIPTEAFAFIFLDPKGWRIPMQQISPLLKRPNSEVLFNFMFEFINRAASSPMPVTVAGLDELLLVGPWREELARVEAGGDDGREAARIAVLIDAFRAVLRKLGDYKYVADVPVLRPVRDRLLYSLVYATRSATGIEVFRDCQIKTLWEQDAVRSATKAKASGQSEMFGERDEMGPSLTQQFLQAERASAEGLLIKMAPKAPGSVRWALLWPEILARHSIRLTELNGVASRLRSEGRLVFADWQVGKRVPQANYRVQRA